MNQLGTFAPCYRFDLSRPVLIFGGALLVAGALCGTLEASAPMVGDRDVRVLGNEAVADYGLNPHASDCRRKGRNSRTDTCDKPSVSTADMVRGSH